jgi:mono/diheme cytochrome c family protein
MGNRPHHALALAVFLVVAPWPGDVAPAAPGDEIGRGRTIAEVHCSRCHAIGNEGESPMPQALPLRDLQRRYPVDALAEALAEGIVTGHPQMPVFTFSTDEIDGLLAYLESLD